MNRIAKRACPICKNELVEVLHAQRFELPNAHPLADGYDVVSCVACGFAYADTGVPQEAYDRYYASQSKYEDNKTSTGGGTDATDRKRLDDTAQSIADFLGNPNARILDIGCANGGLLQALRATGYSQICGIDPSPVCVANTRALGIEAHSGSLLDPAPIGEFDCVILSHTLEHIEQLRQAMHFVEKSLRTDSNAVLYAEVPDATQYKAFVVAPFQDFNTEHINHFSLVSLGNLLRSCEFEVLREGRKLRESSPGMPYPAIFAFGCRSARADISIVKDDALCDDLKAYIYLSRQLLHKMEGTLRQVLAKHPRVIVWGTGQLTLKLLVETSLARAEIAAFVDSNPINQGKSLRGARVLSPDAIRGLSEPIIIASTLHQQSIIDQIRSMGLTNELVVLMDGQT